ncbi:hypothetical protein [Xanthomonas citri]|uniref:hypothetical protein n=1 Tax=Xanthomonas citri TaxID=346 RepID=UPI0005B4C151|nr:hypothetical protein [Xanthomonas citri]AMU98497.1 hypothetical protein TP37_10670 [Xanthomonas citri pv. aurantifolii]AMV03393.1 hypothetical protein TP50_13835 [Xanthomonas citri pv. aurantifolii]MCC8488455.1 hypothetical protein [Xanthomonas citri pv. fuscans]TBW94967.1 hypothetical protein TP47_17070 [Xanthomonas citri pv. aurantifolii]TBW97080.1 hypothetical protein TP49_10790 [Xanthomonas citri pv. aurantifolii]
MEQVTSIASFIPTITIWISAGISLAAGIGSLLVNSKIQTVIDWLNGRHGLDKRLEDAIAAMERNAAPDDPAYRTLSGPEAAHLGRLHFLLFVRRQLRRISIVMVLITLASLIVKG